MKWNCTSKKKKISELQIGLKSIIRLTWLCQALWFSKEKKVRSQKISLILWERTQKAMRVEIRGTGAGPWQLCCFSTINAWPRYQASCHFLKDSSPKGTSFTWSHQGANKENLPPLKGNTPWRRKKSGFIRIYSPISLYSRFQQNVQKYYI